MDTADAAALLNHSMRLAGFHESACLPLELLDEPRFPDWIAAGNAGTMDWLVKHVRVRRDPRKAFPRTRSVTVGLHEFGAPLPAVASAHVAHYAQGADYHLVVKDMLRDAAARVKAARRGTWTRTFVDADPLNEKRCAEIAGLGFIGKHTNLIVPARGSWFFIGMLLTSLEVPPPPPAQTERCGTCTACLDVCPTKAFPAPFVLDARRCISYLTIELQEVIPRELRAGLGAWIFGCDLCLAACPWNRFAATAHSGPFAPRSVARSELPDWLRLTPAEFELRFADSAMLRTGWTALLRNVLVACGNSRDSTLYETVAAFAEHSEPLLRLHAHWALARIDPVRSRILQKRCSAQESDAAVLEEIALCLAETALPERA